MQPMQIDESWGDVIKPTQTKNGSGGSTEYRLHRVVQIVGQAVKCSIPIIKSTDNQRNDQWLVSIDWNGSTFPGQLTQYCEARRNCLPDMRLLGEVGINEYAEISDR